MIIVLIALFAGIILGVSGTYIFVSKLMFSVNESKFDFVKTIEVLKASVDHHKWSIPYQYDLQQTMTKNGFEVLPVNVFSICKPDVAVKILSSDQDRHISSMMPCRISVYQKTNGKTYVSRMNAGFLSKLLGGKAKAIMGEAGNRSEDILKAIIK
jgi:uncharacterized protein (DUF302 family)